MNYLASIFTPLSPSFSHLLWAVDYLENNSKCLLEWIPFTAFIKAQYDYWQDESWFPDDSEIEKMDIFYCMVDNAHCKINNLV